MTKPSTARTRSPRRVLRTIVWSLLVLGWLTIAFVVVDLLMEAAADEGVSVGAVLIVAVGVLVAPAAVVSIIAVGLVNLVAGRDE